MSQTRKVLEGKDKLVLTIKAPVQLIEPDPTTQFSEKEEITRWVPPGSYCCPSPPPYAIYLRHCSGSWLFLMHLFLHATLLSSSIISLAVSCVSFFSLGHKSEFLFVSSIKWFVLYLHHYYKSKTLCKSCKETPLGPLIWTRAKIYQIK